MVKSVMRKLAIGVAFVPALALLALIAFYVWSVVTAKPPEVAYKYDGEGIMIILFFGVIFVGILHVIFALGFSVGALVARDLNALAKTGWIVAFFTCPYIALPVFVLRGVPGRGRA